MANYTRKAIEYFKHNPFNFQYIGFYKLYQIDVNPPDDDSTETDRYGTTTGLKTTYGSRGAIMAHYHMSWNDLLWSIPWATMQRIMIDAPSYKPKKVEPNNTTKTNEHKITKDNAKEIIAMMNSNFGF